MVVAVVAAAVAGLDIHPHTSSATVVVVVVAAAEHTNKVLVPP